MVKILKAFDYSANGITSVHCGIGSDTDAYGIDANTLVGLAKGGYIEATRVAPRPPAVTLETLPPIPDPVAPLPLAAVSTPSELPADWRSAHHLTVIGWAKTLCGATIRSRSEAISALEKAGAP